MKKITHEYRQTKRLIKLFLAYLNDFNVYRKSSLVDLHENVSGVHAIGLIVRLYHTIEKGLSVKERRLEFGLKNVELLQHKLLSFDGDKNNAHIKSAVKTLEKYYSEHESLECSDEFLKQKEVFKEIQNIYKCLDVEGGVKTPINISDIEKKSAIEIISSRSSIREYQQDSVILESDLLSIIDIAKLCPSACNRHAIKIYYSLDKKQNNKILELQNGSRTFRDNVPGLLIVTSDLRYQEGIEERNLGLIEGGIWIMSLINSLHLKGFASCVLNWCVAPSIDNQLKRLVGVPKHNQITALISFGYPEKEQKVPYSIRRESIEFMQKITIDE